MQTIPHWSGATSITVAESKGGVLVTTTPDDNLIRSAQPWPTPELPQKYYASSRFRGKTAEDDAAAKASLGHYCDLQSLNSEDAVTWSFFGPLVHGAVSEQRAVFNRVLESIGADPIDDTPACWLW